MQIQEEALPSWSKCRFHQVRFLCREGTDSRRKDRSRQDLDRAPVSTGHPGVRSLDLPTFIGARFSKITAPLTSMLKTSPEANPIKVNGGRGWWWGYKVVVVVLIISEKFAKASGSEEPSLRYHFLTHRLSLMELLMLYHVFLREVHMVADRPPVWFILAYKSGHVTEICRSPLRHKNAKYQAVVPKNRHNNLLLSYFLCKNILLLQLYSYLKIKFSESWNPALTLEQS